MKKWSALRGAFIWAILPYLGSRLNTWYNEIVGQEIDGIRLGFFKKAVK